MTFDKKLNLRFYAFLNLRNLIVKKNKKNPTRGNQIRLLIKDQFNTWWTVSNNMCRGIYQLCMFELIKNRPSLLCLWRLHQHLDLALKSVRIIEKKCFFEVISFKIWLNSILNCANSWQDSLGKLLITDTITNLLLYNISNTRHSVMGVIFNMLIGRLSLK